MNTHNPLIKYSHETSVVILLILLVIVGVAYNIFSPKEPDFTQCPLCNESVIYYQNEGVALPNETITF